MATAPVLPLPLVLPSSAASHRSCSAVHDFQPCVKKAEQRLSQLGKRLEEWQDFHRAESELRRAVEAQERESRALLSLSATESDDSVFIGTVPDGDASRRRETSFTATTNTNSTAYIVGRNVTGHVTARRTQSTDDSAGAGAILSARMIFHDVSRLLNRLDKMQRVISKALAFEQAQVRQLRLDIKEMEKQRLITFPEMAQKAHEKYFLNLSELEWQVKYEERQEIRLDNKLRTADGQLGRINDEIAFFSDYKEIMDQKTREDKATIEELRGEYDRICRLVGQHKMDVSATENKLLIEVETVAMTRKTLRLNLEAAKDELRRVNDDVERANETYSGHLQTLVETRNKAADNADRIKHCTEGIAEHNDMQKDFNEKIASLLISVREAIDDQRLEDLRNVKLDDTRQKKFVEEKDIESTQSLILAEAVRQQHATSTKLKNIRDEIKRMQMETETADKETEKAVKGFDRAKKELVRIQEQMDVVSEECAHITGQKKGLEVTVNAATQLLREEEGKLSNDLAKLKKEEQEEDREQVAIQTRILSDQHVIQQRTEESKAMETQATDVIDVVEEEAKKLNSKVEKLAAEWSKCEETRNAFRDRVEQAGTELRNTEERLLGQIGRLEPEREQLMAKVEETGNLVKELHWERDMLEKKVKDASDSNFGLTKLIAQTEEEIKTKTLDLRSKQEIVRVGREREARLEAELKEVREFRRQSADKHGQYVALQQTYLQDCKHELAEGVTKNSRLAEHYRLSQEKSMLAKGQLAEVLEQRSQLDESLRDHRQLVDWQRRMHTTLENVFKRRQYDSHQYLQRSVESAMQNGESIHRVGQGLTLATQAAKRFLDENSAPPEIL